LATNIILYRFLSPSFLFLILSFQWLALDTPFVSISFFARLTMPLCHIPSFSTQPCISLLIIINLNIRSLALAFTQTSIHPQSKRRKYAYYKYVESIWSSHLNKTLPLQNHIYHNPGSRMQNRYSTAKFEYTQHHITREVKSLGHSSQLFHGFGHRKTRSRHCLPRLLRNLRFRLKFTEFITVVAQLLDNFFA